MAGRWTLKELADFEEFVSAPPAKAVPAARLRELLSDLPGRTEEERRRNGLYTWYRTVRESAQPRAGAKLLFALKAARIVLSLLSFLAGIALMGGLIERIGLEGKAYNIWKVLALTLGLPWFLFLAGCLSLLFIRRGENPLTLLEELLGFLVKRFAGKEGATAWNTLYRAGKAYRRILSWRLTRLLQATSLFFNLGLIVSLASSLWFLEISFFWASTLEELSRPQLYHLTQVLSWPWASWFPAGVPTLEALALTQLQIGELNPAGRPSYWYPFLFCCLLVWGVLPRLFFWIVAVFLERRAVQSLTFMEKRHRDLWRSFSHVSGSIQASQANDAVTIIEVGGVPVSTEEIRPFLLQTLRVHPAARFPASTLEGNQTVLDHLRQSPQGALFLVESWTLSPKQMATLHAAVRGLIADHPILYLVVGLCGPDGTAAPPPDEFALWQRFIVELDDPNAEVFAFQPSSPIPTP